MKILFPIDMNKPVPASIDQVAAMLPLADKTIHLLYVNEAWPSYENLLGTSGEFADDWREIVDVHANKVLAEAVSYLTGKCLSVSSEIVSGPPALMIETVARDENCDMTVLMPGKHPMMDAMFLGSVSSNVVKHGPGTMLLVRPMESYPAQVNNVLFGVDGSGNAKEAMLKAVQLFQLDKLDVKVMLFHAAHVADPIRYVSPIEFISRVEQNLILEGETYLADAKRYLADVGVKNVELVVRTGNPAQELIDAAKSMPADLIVLGAEGRTAVQHFLLGSVSHRIAMHAPCAVAIVKKENKPS